MSSINCPYFYLTSTHFRLYEPAIRFYPNNVFYRKFIYFTESSVTSNFRLLQFFIRKIRNTPCILSNIVFDDSTSLNTSDTTEFFSKYFSQIYLQSNFSPPSFPTNSSIFNTFPNHILFYMMLVVLFLLFISIIPQVSIVLKENICSNEEVSSLDLFVLFYKSLKSGIFPSPPKIGSIIPVYKSRDPSNITNYRPISIVPQLRI